MSSVTRSTKEVKTFYKETYETESKEVKPKKKENLKIKDHEEVVQVKARKKKVVKKKSESDWQDQVTAQFSNIEIRSSKKASGKSDKSDKPKKAIKKDTISENPQVSSKAIKKHEEKPADVKKVVKKSTIKIFEEVQIVNENYDEPSFLDKTLSVKKTKIKVEEEKMVKGLNVPSTQLKLKDTEIVQMGGSQDEDTKLLYLGLKLKSVLKPEDLDKYYDYDQRFSKSKDKLLKQEKEDLLETIEMLLNLFLEYVKDDFSYGKQKLHLRQIELQNIRLKSKRSKKQTDSEIRKLGLELVKYLKDKYNVLQQIVDNYKDSSTALTIIQKTDEFGIKAPKLQAIQFMSQVCRRVAESDEYLGIEY